MNDLAIRPALFGGAESVFGLLTQFATSYQPERAVFDRHFPRLIASDHAVILVASLGGEVVGYTLGSIASTRSHVFE